MSKANKRERQRQNREARREYEIALARRRRMFRTARIVVPVVALIIGGGIIISLTSGSSTSRPGVQYATISTSLGDIVVRIADTEAPNSAAQFVRLARKGAYDGIKIIRASTSTGVIQSDIPKGNKTINDEFPKSAYELGDFVLTSGGTPNSNALSFFIVTGDAGTQLPQQYNRFGHVIRGLDVAQEIQALSPASGDGTPTQAVTITSIVVTTKRPTIPPSVTSTAPATTAPAATPSS